MVDLWVLHIDSLRRTFDQSLMKIFQRVQEIWSGQESFTEGQTDRWTDGQTKAISINPPSASRRGINKGIIMFIVHLIRPFLVSYTKRNMAPTPQFSLLRDFTEQAHTFLNWRVLANAARI